MGKKRPSPADTTATTSDTVRLHITPLTADTASSILPADTDLSTVSYHTLPTFPESPFGFVDLPVAAAEKLKKKLRGAIFRGVKVRVEDARAEEWKSRLAAAEEGPEKKRVKREKWKKKEGVIEGFQLPDERRIARGWTEKSDKKKKEKQGECLFKAGIPANKADLIMTKEKTKEEKALEKEEKKKQKKEEKRKMKIVKEFENTQKFPNFLKESQLDPTIRPANLVGEFVEEVGWVNGKGVVVEQPVKKKSKKDKKKKEAVPEPVDENKHEPDSIETVKETVPVVATVGVDMVDTASVSSEEAFYDVPEQNEESPVVEQNSNEKFKEDTFDETESVPNPPEDEESAAASSESEVESEESDDEETTTTTTTTTKDETKLQASTTVPETSSEAPTKTAASPAPARERPTLTIHPLEAIYKPVALTDSPTNDDGFKFGFGGDFPESDDDNSNQDATTIATTPYKDPSRYRSSAPTPDTAIGNKRFFSPDTTSPTKTSFTPSTPHAPSSHLPGSDVPLMFPHYDSPFLHGLSIWSQIPTPKAFLPKEGEEDLSIAEIWKNRFYEQRGEWNRDWKRRRKEALKTKRKMERNGPGPSGNRA
ncbi:hypothetical protein BDD12DRAFT_853191 [Trichophaea hybrida]|nr:hypothetical protein BDD12DRAFT_853191 [Trichophaea hybrida]